MIPPLPRPGKAPCGGALPRRLLVAALAGIAAAPACFVAWPLPEGLLDRQPLVVRIADRRGLPLREALPDGAERALPLPSGPLPRRVVDAFLATEDKRFFDHPGVDPLAVARTLRDSARAGRITGGASTVTQQLARQLAPRPRSAVGKLREMLWALRLTVHLPRERILRAYLERVALGEGTLGVEAAARAYFRRPAGALSTAQAALLAGMAASPARFDPRRHPDEARARLRRVLARMEALGSLSADEARVAADDPLDLAPPVRPFRAPHFVAHVLASLPAAGLGGAVEVETTLDFALQREVDRIIAEELAGLDGRGVGEAAVLVLDNATGDVLAWSGSAAFDDADGQNDGVTAPRQPGSSLKPFAYGLALASGMTPSDLIADTPARFATASGTFAPRNYDRRARGPVRLRAALANSYNVPAVRVAERLGVERVLETLRAAGFGSLEEDAGHYGLGLVLGDGEVTLLELGRGYFGLARGGVRRPLATVRRARDAGGRLLPPSPGHPPQRFLPEPAVRLLTDILADESARVPAFGLDNALRLPFPVAVKTGTSRAHVDNWTAGYTRERTVAVWAGNFDGRPMQDVSGVTGAGPIFRRVMLAAMRDVAPAPLRDRRGLARAAVCALSGRRAGPHCPSAIDEVFLPGSAPRDACSMHAADGLSAGPEYDAWARAEGMRRSAGGGLPPGPPGGSALLAPADGDEFLLDPGLPLADQAVPVRLRAAAYGRALDLVLDGRPVARTAPPFETRLAVARGAHVLEVHDPATGEVAARARFVVR